MPELNRIRLVDLAFSIAPGAPVVSGTTKDDATSRVLYPRDLAPPGPPPITRLDHAVIQSTPRRDRAVVRAGDVLVAARGTQLRSAVVTPATEGAVASANLLIVRLREGLLPEVLVAYLETAEGNAALLAKATASAVGTLVLTPKALGSLEIAVPAMSVQIQLAGFVRSVRDSLSATERLIQLRTEFVHSVVQQVLAGREVSVDAGVLG